MNPSNSSSPKWEDLVSSALLGTERKPIAAQADAETPSALAAIMRNAPTSSTALLRAASLLGAAKSATINVGTASNSNETLPENSLPGKAFQATALEEASVTAVQLLDLLLGGTVAVAGQQDELIAEWVDGCARHGKVVARRQILPPFGKGDSKF
jgi:hypothetical protein